MPRFTYGFFILFLFAACASTPVPTDRNCTDLVMKTAVRLNAGSMMFNDLAENRIGKSGFFYILSPAGIIVYHPNQPLTGRNVADVPQVEAILASEGGVSTETLGGLSRTVFFRRLESGNTLCLSLDASELEK